MEYSHKHEKRHSFSKKSKKYSKESKDFYKNYTNKSNESESIEKRIHSRSLEKKYSKERKHVNKRSREERKEYRYSNENNKSIEEKAIFKKEIDEYPEKITVKEDSDLKSNNIEKKEVPIKETVCFEPSGILLKFYNEKEGVSLKFHCPLESRLPIDKWRIYVFKNNELLYADPILLTKAAYLIGKDERICDILCENSSISRQHAVIQFRLIMKKKEEYSNEINERFIEVIKPYIMDLESTNGTFLNGEKIEQSRYVELLSKDVLLFGHSERQYMILKEEGEINEPF